jgi:hypothetical protein
MKIVSIAQKDITMFTNTQSQSRAGAHRRLALLVGTLLMAGLLLSACPQPGEWGTFDPRFGVEPTPVVEVETIEVEDMARVDLQLEWQGALEDGTCGQVTVDLDGEGRVGPCDSDEPGAEWLPIHQEEWEEIAAHFGQLSYFWDDESLVLYGQGDVTDEIWTEPMGVWARFVHDETMSERTSSAVRTGLAWQVAIEDEPAASDDAEFCGRLTVTRYGYAYAALEPCAGGPAEALAQGWLTTGEMTQLVEWLRDWAPLYVEAGYVDGQGEHEASAADVEVVTTWSRAIFARLSAE